MRWINWMLIAGYLSFPASVLLFRLDFIHFRFALSWILAALAVLVLVFVLLIIAHLMQPKRRRNRDRKPFPLAKLLIAIVPVIALLMVILPSSRLPLIHNISTDVVDPPEFSVVSQLRPQGSNPTRYNHHILAELQQQAYPNLKTLITEMSVDAAHKRAMVVAEALGWEIVHNNQTAGTIEATDISLIWGFKDDIAIRVQAAQDQDKTRTEIDLHSVSRIGEGDLGANAKRIQRFIEHFE